MKKTCIFALMAASILSLTGCDYLDYNHGETFTIKDMLNREVEIVNEPKKIICMGPGALRQFCYVGDTSNIVGIENCELSKNSTDTKPYLNSIPNYEKLPIIGQGGSAYKPYEADIIKADADVILTSYIYSTDSVKVLNELQQRTKTPVVGIGYNSNGLFAKDIYQSLKLIGKIVGKEKRAEDVVNFFETSKKELVDKASIKPTTKSAYVGAVNHRGSFGIESTTGDFPIFDVSKVKNSVNDLGIVDFKMIDEEALIRLNPEVIILDAGGLSNVIKDMTTRPKLYKQLDAFKNHEVYIELPFVFYSNNFDVALANAYFVGSIFYPEQYKNFNIKEKFNEITKFLLNVEVYDKMTGYYNIEYGKFDYTL